eukprot:1181261-Prorocentrum_minimum.AAC.1
MARNGVIVVRRCQHPPGYSITENTIPKVVIVVIVNSQLGRGNVTRDPSVKSRNVCKTATP